MAATLVSFALCLAYLAVLPFHPWGLAILVGLSVLVMAMIGWPEDEITRAASPALLSSGGWSAAPAAGSPRGG